MTPQSLALALTVGLVLLHRGWAVETIPTSTDKLEQIARRPFLRVAVLLAFCLLLFAPGITSLPPTDRDESRFIQASRQMLETGDFVQIRFQDKARNKKPAGVYWLQAEAVRLLSAATSNEVWPYRLPSLLAASAAVLGLFALLSFLIPAELAFRSALVMGSSLVVIAEAHLAKADATLFLCVVLMQGALGWTFMKPELGSFWKEYARAALVWAALAAGILVKGPVAAAVFGLTAIALFLTEKSRTWVWKLKPFLGMTLAAAIILPWFLAIQSETSGQFAAQAWQGDILPKLIGVHESHGGWPGYYALLSFVSFWPWSLFLPLGVLVLWEHRHQRAYHFLLAWLVPSWLVLELVPTKLPHYSLPLLPPLAVGIALAWRQGDLKVQSWALRAALLWWLLISVLLAVLPIGGPIYLEASLSPSGFIAGIGVGLVILSAFRWRVGLLLGPMASMLILAKVAPQLSSLWPTETIMRFVSELRPGRLEIASTGYTEPSLVFRAGTSTLLGNPELVAKRVEESCDVVGVVRSQELAAFQAALAEGSSATKLGQERAFNYSSGKWVDLSFWTGRGCERTFSK